MRKVAITLSVFACLAVSGFAPGALAEVYSYTPTDELYEDDDGNRCKIVVKCKLLEDGTYGECENIGDCQKDGVYQYH